VPGKRRLHLIGTAPSSTPLKAAKDLTKKEVFCINNAAYDATCNSIVSFVKYIKVKVLSCFDIKTGVPYTKAFRICIDKADRRKFLNKSNWPCNISFRQWSFKTVINDKAAVPTDSTIVAAISIDAAMSPSNGASSQNLATSSSTSLCNISNNTST